MVTGQTAPPIPAQMPPAAAALSWSNLLSRVDVAFDARYADALKRRLRAARRAAGSVVGPWEDLSIDGAADLDMQGNAPAEVSLSATVGHRFGRRTATGRAVQTARGDLLATRHEAQRLSFRLSAVEAFTAWWEAASELEHVVEARDVQAQYYKRLKASQGARLVSAAAVAEVSGELAVLEGRVVEARGRATQARRQLNVLLGPALSTPKATGVSVHGVRGGPWEKHPANPWAQYLKGTALQHHPALEALRREAALARAQSDDHRQQDAPSLGFGAGVRQVGGSTTYGLLLLSGRFGLSGQGKSEALVARGEAEALSGQVERRRAYLRRWLTAEHARWPALVNQRTTLLTKVEKPLGDRVAALAKAVSQGLATEDGLIRARRDLHEAHHQRLAVEAELWASHLRATAFAGATSHRRSEP